MRLKKETLKKQRQILDKKLEPWRTLSKEKMPPMGWAKAIRGALGMTTQQLADRLEIDQAGVVRHEQREVHGTITLEALNEIAIAMNCKLVYAIVPADGFQSLDAILGHQAEISAKAILKSVSHTMRLEDQEINAEDKQAQLARLTRELKENLDPQLWNKK